MQIQDIKQFLTIRKEIYNFHLERLSTKVYRFYNWKYLPPTIWYTFDPKNCEKLNHPVNTLNLKLKESTAEEKIAFKDNIEVQEKILSMVKNRNENFNYRCWLIRLTTWKGKSHVIMDIANYYQVNTLVLTHNVKTLTEMVAKFKKSSNITPAQYWWWKKEVWSITIMTKKSFTLDYDKIKQDFWLVLIDEAPIWFSKKLWDALNIFFDWKKWIWLYWLSWTPFKNDLDIEDLEKYFWLVMEIPNQENNWYNMIPKFKLYDYIYNWRYEYENPAEMRTAISENQERLKEQIIQAKELLEDKKCLLILTDRKNEVENFYNNIKQENTFVFFMTWDTKSKDDDSNIQAMRDALNEWKKVIIIWTIQKVWVWVDIPEIDSILLASAIKFKASVIQAIWRCLRVYKWKNEVIVWIWNDLPILKWQKAEKIKSIESEYLVNRKDIETIKIWKELKIKF